MAYYNPERSLQMMIEDLEKINIFPNMPDYLKDSILTMHETVTSRPVAGLDFIKNGNDIIGAEFDVFYPHGSDFIDRVGTVLEAMGFFTLHNLWLEKEQTDSMGIYFSKDQVVLKRYRQLYEEKDLEINVGTVQSSKNKKEFVPTRITFDIRILIFEY